jgi:UDP-glucose 4-epimerase
VAPCLILGRGFIATAVAATLPPDQRLILPHDAVRAGELPPGVGAVLWGGRHPALGTAGWRIEDELEITAARLAAARGLPFVSLGTRKVYAPSPEPLGEVMPVGPTDRYGEQKLAIETALQDMLGERLTRLRLANLFGHEPGRTTFAGRMLATLVANGEIRFDMSPFTRRDFIPVEAAGRAIAALLRDPPGGIVNVGSGIPLECGRSMEWTVPVCCITVPGVRDTIRGDRWWQRLRQSDWTWQRTGSRSTPQMPRAGWSCARSWHEARFSNSSPTCHRAWSEWRPVAAPTIGPGS